MGIFKFANGRLASLHSSWTEWAEYMYVEIYGKQGYIRIDNRQTSVPYHSRQERRPRRGIRLLQGTATVICAGVR